MRAAIDDSFLPKHKRTILKQTVDLMEDGMKYNQLLKILQKEKDVEITDNQMHLMKSSIVDSLNKRDSKEMEEQLLKTLLFKMKVQESKEPSEERLCYSEEAHPLFEPQMSIAN